MTTVPYWFDDEESAFWSTGVLGNFKLPGKVSVTWLTPPRRKVDRQKSKGKSGGPLIDQGYEPAKIRVDIEYHTREHHEEWQRILPGVNPRREGATKEPFEFEHAAVKEVDIYEWVVVEYDPGKPPSAKNGRAVALILEEYFPEAKTVKKSTGTVKTATTVDTSDASGQQSIAGDLVGQSMYKDPTSIDQVNSMIGDLTGQSVG